MNLSTEKKLIDLEKRLWLLRRREWDGLESQVNRCKLCLWNG